MLNYNVLTEEQAMKERFQLLDEGIYDAVVERAMQVISANGNDMIKLTLSVFGKAGKVVAVYDYLVFTDKMMWKLIHFCKATGLEKEYLARTLSPEMFERKNVKVKVIVQDGKEIPTDKLNGKPKGSLYPAKNAIEDYIEVSKATPGKAPNDASQDDFNDDVPF